VRDKSFTFLVSYKKAFALKYCWLSEGRQVVYPVRNPDVKAKLLPDGHVVLFSEKTDWAHTLTPLAGIAWEFCDGGHDIDEITSRVAQTAGIEAAGSVRDQINEFLDSLLAAGLLTDQVNCT
jgi:hypothetical protein